MKHLFLTALLAGGLHAATIDFNSISGALECTNLGGGFSTAGHSFSTTQIFAACTGTPVSNGLRFSHNGTTTIGLGGDNGSLYNMVRTDGAAFSLQALDFAQWFRLGDFAYSFNATSLEVRGFLGGSQVGSETIAITVVSDGPNGTPDFRTANLTAFGNVDRIALVPFNTSNTLAYALIDNVVVGAASPVPEPSSLALTGLAGVALGLVRRHRRS